MLRVLKKYIDTAALRENWRHIRRRASARRLLAVVKSDAYGHDLLTTATALKDEADGFAVVAMEDAITLRQQGVEKPILLMQGIFTAEDGGTLAKHRLTPVVHSRWQLQALAALPAAAQLTAYLKVNTGMNRLGFPLHEAAAALTALRRLPAVAQTVLMTHFAEADRQGGIQAPLDMLAPLRTPGLPLSLGNSAATLLHGDIGDDWARIGIALYGASPAPGWRSHRALGLHPAMTLTTRLIALRRLSAGARVGYGGDYTAASDLPIGIASVGYGDGYPRRQGLSAAINGRPAMVLGRVSMEMIALDLSSHPTAAIGDTVVLWGDTPAVDDVAAAADTIAYDLLTAAKGEVLKDGRPPPKAR